MRWYNDVKTNGIVLSTRVRLARNLSQYPFSPKLNDTQRALMLRDVKNAIEKYSTYMYNYIDISQKSRIEREALVEEHIISRDFALMPESDRRLLVYDENGSVSIMVGEEDHLRIQAVRPGFSCNEAFEAASSTDNMLSKGLEFAFNDKLGFLTCCPTNTGTGLRVSCMLHLPMLTRNGHIKDVMEFASRLGLTVRGFYGEGSRAEGELYQISNQVTLGISEEETIKRLEDAVNAIVEKEQELRNTLKASSVAVHDRIWRSFGILSNARRIDSAEFLSLWSDCLLGKCSGILNDLSEKNLVQLLIECMPAHVSLSRNGIDTAEKRDIVRAERIREYLSL